MFTLAMFCDPSGQTAGLGDLFAVFVYFKSYGPPLKGSFTSPSLLHRHQVKSQVTSKVKFRGGSTKANGGRESKN